MNTNSLKSISVSNIQTEQEKHWKCGKFGVVVNPRKYKGGGEAFVATPHPPAS